MEEDEQQQQEQQQQPYVQRLKKQFEQLAEFNHTTTITDRGDRAQKCNWWLDEENINDNATNIDTTTTTDANETDDVNVDDDVFDNNDNNDQCSTLDCNEAEQTVINNNIQVVIEDLSNQHQSEEEQYDRQSINSTICHENSNRLLDSSTLKITKIIEELHETEQSYIDTISKGIDDYCLIFDEPNLPNGLRGQKHKIFATIERIRDLHRDQILPALQKCENNIEMLCQQIFQFIKNGTFYIYVQYAINKKISDDICEKNADYLKMYQCKIQDKLGILSLLVQPIQRLPRYKLLLLNLLENLVKQMETEDIKQHIAWCCKAEKHMSRLLETFNESMSINDIIECNDINILHQGRFYKAGDFDIMDPIKREIYRGRIFLFEKSLVYTEMIDKSTYHYRGYFDHYSSLLEHKEAKSKFKLWINGRHDYKTVFASDFIQIQCWMQLIYRLRLQADENGRRKNLEKFRRMSDVYNVPSARSSNESGLSVWRSSNSSGNSSEASCK